VGKRKIQKKPGNRLGIRIILLPKERGISEKVNAKIKLCHTMAYRKGLQKPSQRRRYRSLKESPHEEGGRGKDNHDWTIQDQGDARKGQGAQHKTWVEAVMTRGFQTGVGLNFAPWWKKRGNRKKNREKVPQRREFIP